MKTSKIGKHSAIITHNLTNTERACNCEICNWPVGKHNCSLLNQHIPQELEEQEALRLAHLSLEQEETLRQVLEQNNETIRRDELRLEELQNGIKFLQRELQEHEQMQHALDKVYDSANQQLQLIIQQKTLYENLCHHVHECSQLQKEKLEQIGSELNLLQQKLTLSEVPGFELFREIIHNLKQMNNIKNIEALERMLMEYYRDAQQRLNEKQMQQLKFLEELKHLKPKMDELREELCQTNGGTIS